MATKEDILAPRKRTVLRLNAKQMYELTNLVGAEYTASGKTDAEFAAYAADKLGYAIGDSSIATARETLGLASRRESNIAAASDPRIAQMADELANQSARIHNLEVQVRLLVAFAQKVGKTSDLAGLNFTLNGG